MKRRQKKQSASQTEPTVAVDPTPADQFTAQAQASRAMADIYDDKMEACTGLSKIAESCESIGDFYREGRAHIKKYFQAAADESEMLRDTADQTSEMYEMQAAAAKANPQPAPVPVIDPAGLSSSN